MDPAIDLAVQTPKAPQARLLILYAQIDSAVALARRLRCSESELILIPLSVPINDWMADLQPDLILLCPQSDEGDLVALRPQLLAGELAQPARERAVLTATDPEHVPLGRGRPQVVLEEVDPPPDLRLRLDRRLNAELGQDPLP